MEITRTLFQVLLKSRNRETQGFPFRDEKAEGNSGPNTVVKRINIFRSRSACKQRSQSAFKENTTEKKQEGPMQVIGIKPSESLVDQAMKFINLSPVKVRHQDEINEGQISVINLNENGESCISDHR